MTPIFKLFNHHDNHYLLDGGTGLIYELNDKESEALSTLTEDGSPPISDEADFLITEQNAFDFNLSKSNLIKSLNNNLHSFCIHITTECNFRCTYCCYGSSYPTNSQLSKTAMSMETAKQSAQFIIDHSRNSENIHIEFYGGEPLLNFPILKFITQTLCTAIKPSKQLSFGLTTNAFVLQHPIVEFLILNQFKLSVSVDGPIDVHDRYRKTSMRGSTHNRILKNLYAIRNENHHFFENNIFINALLAPPFDQLKETIHYLSTDEIIGCLPKRYGLLNEFGTTFHEENSIPNTSSEDYRSFINHCKHLYFLSPQDADKCYLEFYQQRVAKRFQAIHEQVNGVTKTMQIKKGVAIHAPHGACLPLLAKTYISSDGHLGICEKDHTQLSLGTVRTGVDTNKVLGLLDAYIEEANERCGHCWAAAYCTMCHTEALFRHAKGQSNPEDWEKSCNRKRDIIVEGIKDYLDFQMDPPAYQRMFGFLNQSLRHE